MKNNILLSAIVLIVVGFNACKLDNLNPQNSPAPTPVKVDTNKTIIANTALVGKWNIVTDTVSAGTINLIFHGTPTDHYTFTKYGNLYINNSVFYNYVDTAIYSITNNTRVQWVNSYYSQNGAVITTPTSSGSYTITSISDHSLVLTQNAATPMGQRYEQITLSK